MNRQESITGQSLVEFTFAMIVVAFLIYGMIRIFWWAGRDLAMRSWTHDNTLMTLPASHNPADQLRADFYRVQPMGAVYNGSITNDNVSQ